MLDAFAWWYVDRPELEIFVGAYVVMLFGAAVAELFYKSDWHLLRAPYFALISTLALVFALSQLVWIASPWAMAWGYLGFIVIGQIIATLIFGYWLCVLSMARSRDAGWTTGWALMAFVPFLNLRLIFSSSQREDVSAPVGKWQIISGIYGVALGITATVFSQVLLRYVDAKVEQAEAAEYDPETSAAINAFLIRATGIEARLAEEARLTQVPMAIDVGTTLVRAESHGREILLTYELAESITSLPFSLRIGLIQYTCDAPTTRLYLQHGAIVTYDYRFADGAKVGSVRDDRATCGI